MKFSDAYHDLERLFQEKVDKDNTKGQKVDEEKSIFLPNNPPDRLVDFVLVGMEPSRDRWAPDLNQGRKNIEQGFRNFAWSAEDFILHFCADRYLRAGEATYHVTDCAKGAMFGEYAQKGREKRWEDWYPLLRTELELVAKPEAPIIAIGADVHRFLGEHMLPNVWGWVIHYSGSAAGARKKIPRSYPYQYRAFRAKVDWEHVEHVAKQVMEKGEMGLMVDKIIRRLRNGSRLTESRKKLMFTYRIQFERVRKEAGLS